MSWDIKIIPSNGSFSNGQHDINIKGDYRVYGVQKLEQDILKILFTEVNQFYSQYQTDLETLIGSNLGVQETLTILAQRIGDSLAYLMALQSEQVQYQLCQGDELIDNILSLNVNYQYEITKNPEDVTVFSVNIALQTKSQQIILINKNITVA